MMSIPTRIGIVTFATFLVIIHLSSCDSELPSYTDPGDLYHVRASGLYVLTIQDNSMKVIVTVINKFDETLDGEAILKGSVKITFARDVQYEKNDTIGPSNLIQARSYNPSTRHLTLNPGDSIRFLYSWNFIDDLGRDLRQGLFHYVADTNCVGRSIAVKETFLLISEVNVFVRTPTAHSGSTEYNICHVNRFVNFAICPPVLPEFCK